MTREIKIKPKFSDWKEISHEDAMEYAKKKIRAITMGKNDEERLALVNKSLSGVQFTLEQLS